MDRLFPKGQRFFVVENWPLFENHVFKKNPFESYSITVRYGNFFPNKTLPLLEIGDILENIKLQQKTTC